MKKLHWHYALYFTLILSLLTLLSALFLQYVMGFEPCALCYKQRYVWYGIFAVSLMAFFFRRRFFLFIFMAFFLLSAALGFYHTAILYDLWAGPSSCAGDLNNLSQLNLNDFSSLSALSYNPLCSSIDQKIMGIPLPLGNVFLSIFGLFGNIFFFKKG